MQGRTAANANLDEHLQEGIGWSDEAAGRRDGLADIARHGNRDEVRAPTLRLVGSKVIHPFPGR